MPPSPSIFPRRLRIRQASRLLQNGAITCEELASYCHALAVAGEECWQLNAFASIVALDDLLAQARDVQPSSSKLRGIPVSIKSNLAVSTQPLTAGSRMLSSTAPCGYDADTVRTLLRENGALLIGTTTMDEFGMGSLGTNVCGDDDAKFVKNPTPFLQASSNVMQNDDDDDETIVRMIQQPHDAILEAHHQIQQDSWPHLCAGGSSSGAAVSIAHGSSLLALGSDTGGSVRLPAAWCGVVGLKPSYGLLSRHGLVSYASSFDTVGLLAPSADCATIGLDVLTRGVQSRGGGSMQCGRDSTMISEIYQPSFYFGGDSTNSDAYDDGIPEATEKTLNGLRIGVPAAFSVSPCPDFIREAWQKGVDRLAQQGATIVMVDETKIDPELIQRCLAAYYVLVSAEASSNLARYDGFRYGLDVDVDAIDNDDNDIDMTPLERRYSQARTQGFGTEVMRRILCGTFVLSSDRFHSHYEAAAKIRAQTAQQLQAVLHDDVDCLVVPTAVSPAVEGDAARNATAMFANDVMTVPFSLAGLPSVSVPVQDGVGLQVVASRLKEDLILRVGGVLEA